MRKFTFLTLAVMALSTAMICACNSGKKAEAEAAAAPVLVAFFSATGNTRSIAEKIAKATGGDLFDIEPEQPYTEADLDGWNNSARGTLEARNRKLRPGIANRVKNFEKYDTIYLGFPIWWYTAPTIINTFLEQYDTKGKTIIPFATSGGSAYGKSTDDLRPSAPQAHFLPGKVLNDCSQKDIDRWVSSFRK